MKTSKIAKRTIVTIKMERQLAKANSIKIKNLTKVTPMFIYLEWV